MNKEKQLLSCWIKDIEKKSVWYYPECCERKPYDVILARGVLEAVPSPVLLLSELKNSLSTIGRLYLYCDNRLGLRYFIGEKDPHTGRFGDGLENYEKAALCGSRSYSLHEIKRMVQAAGFSYCREYSVLPNIENPKFLIASGFRPNERMRMRLFPEYRTPQTVFLNEEYLIDSLLDNDMLPQMANGLLLELSNVPITPDVEEVVISDDRGEENSMVTVLHTDHTVSKKSLFRDDLGKLQTICENHAYLNANGIQTVPVALDFEQKTLRMPFHEGTVCNTYLRNLLFHDKLQFIAEMDRFRAKILQASPIIKQAGHMQAVGFPDMVPINCIVHNGSFLFFDQEFSVPCYPADAIIYRSILLVYEMDSKMESLLPMSFFFERYGLSSALPALGSLCRDFTEKLIAREEALRRDYKVVAGNRNRMNYSESEYELLKYNPVAGLENGKALILYGTTEAAGKFIELYQRDYSILAVIPHGDCSECTFGGFPVISMEELSRYSPKDYRIILCIPDYELALLKLKRAGATEICTYEPDKVYPGRQACRLSLSSTEKKRYHIGYVAGVFDLYHMGHLNLFRRAKEQCDYLIAGVVTDEGVRDFKKTEPFIPFEERLEMVRACKYVDEAVEIPYYYRGTVEAFQKYHFDVQFSGSDYSESKLWLYHKQWLKSQGADLVFLPYTAQTSSSKIKALIAQRLV